MKMSTRSINDVLLHGNNVLTTGDVDISSLLNVVEFTVSKLQENTITHDEICKPNTVLLFRDFDKLGHDLQIYILELLIHRENMNITLRSDTRLVIMCNSYHCIPNPIKNKMVIL